MTIHLTSAEWLDLFMHFAALSLLGVGGAITTAPDMHRYLVGEQRWLTVGSDALGRVLTVCYTLRGDDIRLISARLASKKERTHYES